MTEKEFSEIRRRFNIKKTNISYIRGCYVNEKKEIISEFNQFFGTLPEDESEEILAVIKRTLSGAVGKNLVDIEFSNQQVMDSEEHKLLMDLKNSELKDDDAVQKLYKSITQTISMEERYLILLTFDKYDIPSYSKDDIKLDDSSEVFSYVICSICPVKLRKPALGYYTQENIFHNTKSDWVINSPELGFMFPAFDDRQTNIYNAVYYTKDTTVSHEEFIDTIFKTEIPMPAAEQQETFNRILEEAVSEECNYEVVQNVHGKLSSMIAEHKASKVEEPLVISKGMMKGVLTQCGVAPERVMEFEEKYDDSFGEKTELNPKNIIDTKKFEVCTPDVTIKVKPEYSSMVQTKVIDGIKYILIRAGDNVEVNGVSINIE